MKFSILVFLSVLFLLSGCSGPVLEEVEINESGIYYATVVSDRFIELMDERDVILVDVRTEQEFKTGHIEGAINIDYYKSNFESELFKLERNKTYLVYCRSGARSFKSLDTFYEYDFERVYNLKGGVNDWTMNGGELVE